MDNLTPTLNEAQLKGNIDALQQQGKGNNFVQSYVNNYQRTADGTYTLKQPQTTQPVQPVASTQPPTTTEQKDLSSAQNFNPSFPAKTGEGNIDTLAKGLGNVPSSSFNALKGFVNLINPVDIAKTAGSAAGDIKNLVQEKGALNTAGDIAKNTPGVAYETLVPKFLQDLISGNPQEAHRTLTNDPINQLLPLLLLARGGAEVMGKGEAFDSAINSSGSALQKTVGNAASLAKEATGGALEKIVPSPTAEDLTGKITQAKPNEIPQAKRGLQNIDTSNVKTFKDLSSEAQKTAEANTKEVDARFAKSDKTYTIKDLPRKPGQVTSDYVGKALSHLEELYGKIEDPQAESEIKQIQDKYKSDGLTPKEINDVAKQYGSEFGKKAFGKAGEPLTSVNARAFENIRTGTKETARNLMPDEETRTLDKQTTDVIKLKDLAENMHKQVQMLENKFQKAGVVQKTAGYVGKGIDLFSGGFLKGIFKGALGIGDTEGRVLNPIELQKNLQKNLSKLQKLNKMKPEEAIKILKGSE